MNSYDNLNFFKKNWFQVVIRGGEDYGDQQENYNAMGLFFETYCTNEILRKWKITMGQKLDTEARCSDDLILFFFFQVNSSSYYDFTSFAQPRKDTIQRWAED